jgi:sugar-phosphatase
MLGSVGVVLFDVDGVLRDSYHAHLTVWRAWCAQRGLDQDRIGLTTFGRRPRDVIAGLAPALDAAAECAALDRLLAGQGPIAPMPGAAHLLEGLAPECWAIVTSGDEPEVRAWFAGAGLPQPPAAVFGGETARGKPDPACYLLGAHRLGAAPRDCLVVEDVPAGVRAGQAAGMTVLGIGSSHPESMLDADLFTPALTDAAEIITSWASRLR